jgi:type IV secretion system protein VirB5
MMTPRKLIAAAVASALIACSPADATIPVIDVAAIQQMIQEMLAWQQQLNAMQSQLNQLRQTHTALTGNRGLGSLLHQTAADRNYLPSAWRDVDSVGRGISARYAQLHDRVRALVRNNARITDDELSHLPAGARQAILAARDAAATGEALTRAAYERSSDRFSSLGQLIDRINSTGDVKAIAELQGRIAAEQAMLENEAVKLQSYSYATDASRASAEVARREAVIQGHGVFATRFQPTPPAP